nr:inner membrane transport protein [Salmonella sp. NCTC 7297]
MERVPVHSDIDEMITRQRREGLFAAVMTFSRKTTVAIATLSWRYVAGRRICEGEPDPAGERRKHHRDPAVCWYCGLLLIALWQAVTFHLNKRTHKIFVDEVDRLKAHGLKQNVTPETRRVVEDLTGYAYEDLWNEPQKTGAKLHRPAQVN